ncbi:MAG: hypothetical protein AAGB07_00105 [Pseudomonadota bacterium]
MPLRTANLMLKAGIAFVALSMGAAAQDDPFAAPERAWQQGAIYKNTIPQGWETLILADTEEEREIADRIIEIYQVLSTNPSNETLAHLVVERYIQHSIFLPNGRVPFSELFGESAEQYPVKIDVHRIIVQDKYAFAHVNFRNLDNDDPTDLGIAAVDIYRFNDDLLLAEHWDVLQDVPTFSPNPNGMFLLAE